METTSLLDMFGKVLAPGDRVAVFGKGSAKMGTVLFTNGPDETPVLVLFDAELHPEISSWKSKQFQVRANQCALIGEVIHEGCSSQS